MQKTTVIAGLVALALALTACGIRQYEPNEAENILQTGQEQLKAWMEQNCPQGNILSIENASRKLPGGNEYLLPCVKGQLSDGRKDRDFLYNSEWGRVYLEPDVKDYRAFQRECLTYTMECMGLKALSTDITEDGKDVEAKAQTEAFFYTALITEMTEPDSEFGLTWGIDGYDASEYVKLPGELVLFGGSIKNYIRNPERGDSICVELDTNINNDIDLTAYTTERIKEIEEKYGLYFKNLHLETESDEIDLLWENNERAVYYYEK